MANSRRLRIGCALVVALFSASAVDADARQKAKVPNEEWKLVNGSGVPARIAANIVIDAPALSHRHIYLLIDGKDFTETNIRTIFTSLASEFRAPHELWIYAYSDRAVVQKAVDHRNSGILCVSFGNSPEGRRGSRNYSISSEPKRSGYYRAQYFRFSDGREQIEYSPHPEQEHIRKIDLKNPDPAYSGHLNQDLMLATEAGDLEKVGGLLEQGASVNSTGGYGNSALAMAAWQGQSDVVRMLLEKGADVNRKDNYGLSALMTAAIDGNKEIVQLLLDKGADVNARTGRDRSGLDDTVLMLASIHGHSALVEELLARGAEIDSRNRFGETALMQAALAGFPEIVLALATHGAEIDATDVDGKTALALSLNDKETVETLLNLGADYKTTDRKGMTPLMQAVTWSQSLKADALVNAGAGKESVEAAKGYLAAPAAKEPYPGYRKEEGYHILTEIYLKMGLKREALETSKQALDVLGDKAHLRARLGFTFLAVGDRESAWAQQRLLKDRAAKAQDRNTKELYRGWADALLEELNEGVR